MSQNIDIMNPKTIENEFKLLLEKNIQDVESLKSFISQWEKLKDFIDNSYSRAHVAVTVDTTNKEAEERYLFIASNVLPLVESYSFKLSKKLLDSPAVTKLPSFYNNFIRAIKTEVEIFNEANLSLKVEEKKLVNEYDKITGALTVNFDGQEMTLQMLAKYLENLDPAVRENAYKARAEVRRKVIPELNELYKKMLKVRHQIALNAGFKNFREYQFKAMHRFDYTPSDCLEFHDAIEKVIVPKVKEFHLDRIKKLKLKTLRPWDTLVNPDANKNLQPFKTVKELVEKCRKIFHQVDAEIGSFFDDMIEKNLLDLESRKGKATGGYCTHFPVERVPFIFMNAVGTKRDVETLLHEGGHSFHYYLARNIELSSYHQTSLEFAEVASMSMELLARPFLKEFYKDDELKLVLVDQLKKILEFFPFMAMVDAFQHWVYTHGENGGVVLEPSLWSKKWQELEARFNPMIDWTGFEDIRDHGWQYPHIFWVPFYYVEYGIAQMGALTIWKQSLENYNLAVEKYKKALSLGATKTLPELFQSIGGVLKMNEHTLKPLVDEVIRAI
jgi:oligoendopeptidase F